MSQKSQTVPFYEPYMTGNEIPYLEKSLASGKIVGNAGYTRKCEQLLEETFNAKEILLTNSCTAALEMASLLLDLQPGDEVIVPSFTFVSTVNAFMLRGAKPVFVDIRSDTMNIDVSKIEEKITNKTKAVYPIHYAGIGCDMAELMNIADRHDLLVVEDAAQGVNAQYNDRFLGTLGTIGAYSFHGTKNYTCGEGGAIVINKDEFLERAEILREKGTDKSKFLRGEIDKYTWVDIGSSYLVSDMLAAFLLAQLEQLEEINEMRRQKYDYYFENLKDLNDREKLKLPFIPENCKSNYHMFYIVLPTENIRNKILARLREFGIQSVFHYIPLHSSPRGKLYGYKIGDMPVTEDISGRLLRIPFYPHLEQNQQDYVIEKLEECLR